MNVAVCSVTFGNLRSVMRAIQEAAHQSGLSVNVQLAESAEALLAADKVVYPGQGSFASCASSLTTPVRQALGELIGRGTPYLGICLGMQILLQNSEESPESAGLGIFKGQVRRLRADPARGLKVPHMGWNTVEARGAGAMLPEEPTHFYFVHSYVARPDDERIVAGITRHDDLWVSAIARDNVWGVQFHPEKSQTAGLQLLTRFLKV